MSEEEKRKAAVALKYDMMKDMAPKLVAKGRGSLAEKIIEVALQSDIPIVEDADLVAVLSKLDIDQEIPPELYQAVAEILSFVYRMSNKWRQTQE